MTRIEARGEVGSGEAVVFVHGGISDLRSWAGQLEPIGTRAIAYSRRHAWPNDEITPGAADPMPPHVDDAPALLLSGDRSPAVVTALSDWLALLLRHAWQVRVPGASHLVHEDDASFVNAAVLDFIGGPGRRRPGR